MVHFTIKDLRVERSMGPSHAGCDVFVTGGEIFFDENVPNRLSCREKPIRKI